MNSYKIKMTFLLLTSLLALTTVIAKAQEKSFKVSKGGKLEVKIDLGDIRISTWEKDEVLVKSGKGLEFEQSGSIISVKNDDYFPGSPVVITIPNNFNAHIQTGAGNLEIKGTLNGSFSGKTSGGNIRIDNITGAANLNTFGGNIFSGQIKGNADLNTGGGDVKLSIVDGSLNLKAGGGNISIEKITGTLKLKTGGGNVKIKDIGKDANISAGGGNISIENLSGSSRVVTGGGNIKINQTKGELTAATGSGNIAVLNAFNKTTLTTGYGDIEIGLNQSYSGAGSIKTENGNIKVLLPSTVKATIMAKVNSWHQWDEDETKNIDNIKSDFNPVTIDRRSNEVLATYNINGGGSVISTETSNGIISIRKK